MDAHPLRVTHPAPVRISVKGLNALVPSRKPAHDPNRRSPPRPRRRRRTGPAGRGLLLRRLGGHGGHDGEQLARRQCRGIRVAGQVQQQVDDLRGKADKLRDDLNTVMRESNGGPAAAVLGVLNQKADALNAQLTLAKADAQEDLGPKITSAQEEITTALEPVTVAVDKLCPSS